MDRFIFTAMLMLLSMSMLFASPAYVGQMPLAGGQHIFTAGVMPVADMLNSWMKSSLEATQKVARQAGQMYWEIKNFVDSTMISINSLKGIQVSG